MISEFSIAILLIVLPLIGGGTAWFHWEFDKSKSAFQSFVGARQELIQTEHSVSFPVHIGEMSERVELYTLEELDQGPDHLTPSDLGQGAFQLWEDASHSFVRLQELASTASSIKSKL